MVKYGLVKFYDRALCSRDVIVRKIIILYIASLFLLNVILPSCAIHSQAVSTKKAIRICDDWWAGIKNENPNFYQVISINKNLVVHLCGSRTKIFVEFHKIHPDQSLINLLTSNTYMFTIHYPRLKITHIWLVVKIVDKKIILHKWATGHEFIRLLSLYSDNFLNADGY